jgi:NAD+ kinase
MLNLVRPTTGTVAFYITLERERAHEAARRVTDAVREAGFAVAMCSDSEADLAGTAGASAEDAILLVTIGGDGTLLRAAQIAAPLGIPLFGINTGRLGFLTELDADGSEGHVVANVLRDGFIIEERIALEARLRDGSHMALNDIVVRRGGTAKMTPFGLFVDGKEAAHVPADGVVVATPTGSTAYLLSAGGPILAPDVAAFGIVALLPHTLFTRPLVVPDTSTVTVTCAGEVERATLEADGRVVDELGPGDRVTVTRYPRSVRFARRAPLNFFALLEEKLRWNAPIKGARADE